MTLGIVAGVIGALVHVTMLWAHSHRLSVWSELLAPIRLGVVCLILFVAAVNGQIIVTASAWAISFATFVLLFVMADTRPRGPHRVRTRDRVDNQAEARRPRHAT